MSIENDEESAEGNNVNDIPHKKVTAYQKLPRDLTEAEVVSPGALKLMLNDIDRLNEEVARLSQYRDDFYSADKEKAILTAQLSTKLSKEVLYSITITLGATLIGFSPEIWDLSTKFGIIDLAFGVVLVIGGLFSKFNYL